MAFWKLKVDQIITSKGFPLLSRANSINNEQTEENTGGLHLTCDQDRKKQEAIEADPQDKSDLGAREIKLKRRKK